MQIALREWVRQQKDALGQVDFQARMWLRPENARIAQVDGDSCVVHDWPFLSRKTQSTPIVAKRALLWRFLRLADASDATICKFVLNHGGLQVTNFGAPGGAVPWIEAGAMNQTPCVWYRYYSRLAATFLRLAASLAEQRDKQKIVIAADDVLTLREHNTHWNALRRAAGEAQWPELPGERIQLPMNASELEEWEVASPQRARIHQRLLRKGGKPLPPPPPSEYPGETLQWRTNAVESAVKTTLQWWLAVSWIKPSLRRQAGAWVEDQFCANAWSALGLSLRTVLLQDQRAATCDHCGRAVARSRRPPAGRRAWCPENPECRRAKERAHKREQRARI